MTNEIRDLVLMVDDNEPIRRFATIVLRRMGFDVLGAVSGADALRSWQQAGRPVRLVVTDLVMPGMPGRELATRLRLLQPGIPVIFTSGYDDDEAGAAERGDFFLMKPFGPDELAAIVRLGLSSSPVGDRDDGCLTRAREASRAD